MHTKGVRGMGLIQGLVLSDTMKDKAPTIVNDLFKMGILVNLAGDGSIIRCIPPLIVSTQEIDVLVAVLEEIFSKYPAY